MMASLPNFFKKERNDFYKGEESPYLVYTCPQCLPKIENMF